VRNNLLQDCFDLFISSQQLSDSQADQFKRYIELLQVESNKISLTAIRDSEDILDYHFKDSLTLSKFVDFTYIKTICDIGTGAGFPGVPLKIVFPKMHLLLIEVNQKKIKFLEKVIEELKLQNVKICPFDWRTFLRKKINYNIDIFVTRATLDPQELIRVFSPASEYRKSVLVYWASIKWEPSDKVIPFLKRQETYQINEKPRKLVFLSI